MVIRSAYQAQCLTGQIVDQLHARFCYAGFIISGKLDDMPNCLKLPKSGKIDDMFEYFIEVSSEYFYKNDR